MQEKLRWKQIKKRKDEQEGKRILDEYKQYQKVRIPIISFQGNQVHKSNKEELTALNKGYVYDNLTVADLKKKDKLEEVKFLSFSLNCSNINSRNSMKRDQNSTIKPLKGINSLSLSSKNT